MKGRGCVGVPAGRIDIQEVCGDQGGQMSL
jgi:hypothetical protein